MATSDAAAAALSRQHQYSASSTNAANNTLITNTIIDEARCVSKNNETTCDNFAINKIQPEVTEDDVIPTPGALNKKLLLCRRFKDSGGSLRNFNSLPLFVYATSSSTRATSADGIGVSREAVAAAKKNDTYDLALGTTKISGVEAVISAMDCLPLNGGNAAHHLQTMTSSSTTDSGNIGAPTVSIAGGVGGGGLSYQQHLNLNHPHLLSHHSPYSNNYPLHHNGNHHHMHSDQTKSLQELQHEVGALLEFRDLVIETFPDLKHKMASMSSSTSSAAVGSVTTTSVSATNTLTGGMSNSSLASRREWEPGIRTKRKISQKEPSTSTSSAITGSGATGIAAAAAAGGGGGELSSSSLTRSRSNSHSGKKEPKSGENNNGSVVQDSGFSTETSSSKEGHSASSTNGAMTGPMVLNRLSCPESDDELLNLLDVIHRKSNRLREEVEHLQNYERQNLHDATTTTTTTSNSDEALTGTTVLSKSSSGTNCTIGGLTPKTFREHVERLNKEDIKQLRRERDRLLDKLAEMEAETLTGRIKAAKMNDQMEELISVKKDLEEQLKAAMAQKLELSSRVQQMQMQQQQLQSKSSSSQSDYSSQRNFLSSATTVLSTGSGASHLESALTAPTVPSSLQNRRQNNTFQPVVVEQQEDNNLTFHQSAGSDNKQQQQQQQQQLGRLDGIVSNPGTRNTKCRTTDSKRIAAILLETNVIELQRHLLTLTVQNQVLMQKLDLATKSKVNFAKRLDKSKDDVEDLRFQLEEKNIELEGTKAQLRVLESRIHSSTPSSGVATNSYLNSHNDYETNRSSASTTLMLSRRGIGSGIDSHCSELSSGAPISQLGQMPPPTSTQISTPSMKAMVHLPMDEIQHHSSSTESAHDHDIDQGMPRANRLMSTSVGGTSPFERQQLSPRGQQLQIVKKFNAATKPSKIPLPGSKAAAYFAGKPPSGRPSTAGRSPPSVNASSGSNSSNKFSLSRSTGNLLSNKSPNSLKRADSAQSIRKDISSSFSTNNSRTSSTSSSSIPINTTPYSMSKSTHGVPATTPSPRALQNSPLPKLKRESLTSRVRHLDSLSRVHQQNLSNSSSNASENSPATPSPTTTATTTTTLRGNTNGNYLISSTPKPSSIAAQFNSALRKDIQLSSSSFSNGSQPFLKRTTGGGAQIQTPTNVSTTIRRFSSASIVGTRVAAAVRNQEQNAAMNQQQNIVGVNGGNGSNNSGSNVASDSDSGKVRTLKSTFLGWLKI